VDREVIWSDPAWDDVENAADYIAQDCKLRLHWPTLLSEAGLSRSLATHLSENCS